MRGAPTVCRSRFEETVRRSRVVAVLIHHPGAQFGSAAIFGRTENLGESRISDAAAYPEITTIEELKIEAGIQFPHPDGGLGIKPSSADADSVPVSDPIDSSPDCASGRADGFRSFVPLFISVLMPEDRRHLNSLAMDGGRVRNVTAFAPLWRPSFISQLRAVRIDCRSDRNADIVPQPDECLRGRNISAPIGKEASGFRFLRLHWRRGIDGRRHSA
jgi:hypothetical protein